VGWTDGVEGTDSVDGVGSSCALGGFGRFCGAGGRPLFLLPGFDSGTEAQYPATLSLPPAALMRDAKAGLSSALPGAVRTLAMYARHRPVIDGSGVPAGGLTEARPVLVALPGSFDSVADALPGAWVGER
jgi:hypothetical protein